MPAQTVVTQRGDRLVDLTKRIYQIRDPDRALTVALVVSTFNAKNRSALQNRVGVPLEASLEIEFPEWADIQAAMKAQEARKKAVQQRIAAGPTAQVASVQAPRAIAIVRQAPLGERTLTKELMRALGQNAATLTSELRPLMAEDVDPSRTSSAGAARILAFGRKIALDAPRTTLVELFALSERAFFQTLEMVVRQANPRAFQPSVDVRPTLNALAAGFYPGVVERLLAEAKAEVERRRTMLARAIDRIEPASFSGGGVSALLGDDVAAAIAELRAGLHAAPTAIATPGIAAQVQQQYGVTGSALAPRVIMPTPQAELPRLLSFLDVMHPSGGDGALVERVLQLATRVADTHRQAVVAAVELCGGVDIDSALGPNQALGAALPVLLKQLRERRTAAAPEEQTRLLADERHLLSGRNFVSFRKDVAQQLDKRITLATALEPKQRVAVLLALLMQDGHRLPAMRLEDIDTATDRLISAL